MRPTITSLRPGILRVSAADGMKAYVVTGGFAEISASGVSVLAEQAVPLDELSPLALDALIEDASVALASGTDKDAPTRRWPICMPCGPLPASDHIACESGNKVNKSSGRGNMKRFTGAVGIDQGARVLFDDVRDGGAMWQGSGPREVRQLQEFEEPFLNPPAVTVGISMWDIDHK
jgi:hypothetical protein